MNNEDSLSLNKFISNTGMCSRREADKMIEAGRVKINGELAVKGNRVFENDTVTLDDEVLNTEVKPVYIILNKPPGITCTTEKADRSNIIDFVGHKERLFPVGRLDKPSSGLIILTNDGDIVNLILREENANEKEYIVRVDRPLNDRFVDRMKNGIPILGTITKKCEVKRTAKAVFRITLTQGLNRQIRRMCEYLGYKVVSLRRIRIMNLRLDDLKEGKWRNLSPDELAELKSRLNYE